MKRSTAIALVSVLASFTTSCTMLQHRAERNPNYDLSFSAMQKMTQLIDSNSLPGIASAAEIEIVRDSGFNVFDDTAKYPAERTFQLHKRSDQAFTYWYRLAKDAASADWKLIAAWKTDKSGKKEDIPTQSGMSSLR